MQRGNSIKTAYFDCRSGVSGDMFLGALVDAGAPLGALRRELKKVPLKGYALKKSSVKRATLAATKIDVVLSPAAKSTARWKEINSLIRRSALSASIKEEGLKIFRSLFEAEAVVHGEKYDTVHLHELGSADSVVDILGALICLDLLGIKKVISSPVNLGGGEVRTEHGILPVPAPATAELLKGVPVYSGGEGRELATPTGAAIIRGVSKSFGPMPAMTLESTGTGAGSANPKGRPNVLRVFVGETSGAEEEVTVVETNIDDMDPRLYDGLIEKLLKAGALDVFLTQVIMKKGRPGILLTMLTTEELKKELTSIIFTETTTIGLRFYTAGRTVLERTIEKIDTPYGPVRFKTAFLDGKPIKSSPEYEDCKRIAKKTGEPLIKVMEKLSAQARKTKAESRRNEA